MPRTKTPSKSKLTKKSMSRIDKIEKSLDKLAKQSVKTDRQMQETDRRMQETDRRMQETDRQMQETDRRMQETDRFMREFAKNDGERTQRMEKIQENIDKMHMEWKIRTSIEDNRWGYITEAIVYQGDIKKIVNDWGIKVEQVYPNMANLRGEVRHEIDLILANGSETVVIEVKTCLRSEDIVQLQRILANMDKFFPQFSKGKKVYAGFAYIRTADDKVKEMANKNGFFTLKIKVEGDVIPDETQKQYLVIHATS